MKERDVTPAITNSSLQHAFLVFNGFLEAGPWLDSEFTGKQYLNQYDIYIHDDDDG